MPASNGGWVKIHRSMLNWEWVSEPDTLCLFVHLLLLANHKKSRWRGVEVERGQCIIGRKKLSKATGLSERKIRTSLKRLKSTSEITSRSTNRFTLITICNYDKYQVTEDQGDQQIDQQIDQRSTSDRPQTRRKEDQEDHFVSTSSTNSVHRKGGTGGGQLPKKKPLNPPNGKITDITNMELPGVFNAPRARQALQEWLDYKREKRQTYTPRGFKKLLTERKDWTIQELVDGVNHSMGSNYSGLFKKRPDAGQGVYVNESAYERQMRQAKERFVKQRQKEIEDENKRRDTGNLIGPEG